MSTTCHFMCELICICCECGIILFPYDVKWVDSRKKTSPYRAFKIENLSYSLTAVIMDKDGVLTLKPITTINQYFIHSIHAKLTIFYSQYSCQIDHCASASFFHMLIVAARTPLFFTNSLLSALSTSTLHVNLECW